MLSILFRLALAALAAGLLTFAQAKGSTVTAEGLSVAQGPLVLRIPKAMLDETPLTRDDVARLFDKSNPAPLRARLAQLSAARIRLPELSGEVKSGERALRFLWRDVELENVAAGRAGAMRAAGLEQSLSDENGERIDARYTNISGKGIDLLAFLQAATESEGGAAKEETATLGDEVVVDQLSIVAPAAGVALRTGRLSANGVRMRWAAPAGKETAPRRNVVFEVDEAEAQNVALSGREPSGERSYALAAKRLTLSKVSGAAIGALAGDELSLESSDGGTLALRHLDLTGLDVAALLDYGRWRVGSFRIAGVAADLPKAEDAGRAKFTIDSASGEFGAFQSAVATKFALGLEHFKMSLAGLGSSAEEFLALGYRDLDLSARAAGAWREEAEIFELAQLRFDAKDMGAADFSASFSNFSPIAFSPNATLSRAALLLARVTRLEATLEGAALVDHMLAAEAKATGQDVDKLRTAYAKDLRETIVTLLGPGDKSRRIGAAAEQFVRSRQRLHVKLSSPKGVGALDAVKSPSELLEQVDVEATAE